MKKSDEDKSITFEFNLNGKKRAITFDGGLTEGLGDPEKIAKEIERGIQKGGGKSIRRKR